MRRRPRRLSLNAVSVALISVSVWAGQVSAGEEFDRCFEELQAMEDEISRLLALNGREVVNKKTKERYSVVSLNGSQTKRLRYLKDAHLEKGQDCMRILDMEDLTLRPQP